MVSCSVCVQKVLCTVEFMSVPQWIYTILSSGKMPYPKHTLCSLPHCAYCLFILVCLCMVTLYNPSGTSGSFKAHPIEGFRPRVVLCIATKMHVLVTNLQSQIPILHIMLIRHRQPLDGDRKRMRIWYLGQIWGCGSHKVPVLILELQVCTIQPVHVEHAHLVGKGELVGISWCCRIILTHPFQKDQHSRLVWERPTCPSCHGLSK